MADEPNAFAWDGATTTRDASGEAHQRRRPTSRSAILIAAVLVVVLVVALVVGLGGSGSGSPTVSVAKFDSEVARICAQSSQGGKALGAPTASDIAQWAQQAAATSTGIEADMAALRPPASDATAYEKLMAGIRSSVAQVEQLATAAKAGNIAQVDALATQLGHPTGATQAGDAAARAAGFGCASF